jgi:hypothetical protein
MSEIIYPHYEKLISASKNPRYNSPQFARFFEEVFPLYKRWNEENMKIKGTDGEAIKNRVELLNRYKDQLELEIAAECGVHPYFGEGESFSAQTKIFSSVLEEFLCYLFKDLSPSGVRIGQGSAFVELIFTPKSFKELVEGHPSVSVKTKDVDFLLGTDLTLIIRPYIQPLEKFSNNKSIKLTIPAIAVECKTNLDKTMLNEAAATAEFLKRGNLYVRYMVLAEYLDFSTEENPRLTKIDQIYILRRMRRPPAGQRTLETFKKRKPIQYDLILHFFNLVKDHLESTWWDPEAAVEKGLLI